MLNKEKRGTTKQLQLPMESEFRLSNHQLRCCSVSLHFGLNILCVTMVHLLSPQFYHLKGIEFFAPLQLMTHKAEGSLPPTRKAMPAGQRQGKGHITLQKLSPVALPALLVISTERTEDSVSKQMRLTSPLKFNCIVGAELLRLYILLYDPNFSPPRNYKSSRNALYAGFECKFKEAKYARIQRDAWLKPRHSESVGSKMITYVILKC